MDIQRLDLNLLVTLEALLAERNVTRAARRLNISQPALSARLARLREVLGDPLLLPAQRGMIPTRRATELQAPLHEALEGVRRVIGEGAPIDPRRAQATVVIAASDYVQYSLLMRLSCVLRTEASEIRIAWRNLEVAMLGAQLERGEVDLALMTPEHFPGSMRMSQLYVERYVVIVRRGHPVVQDTLDLDMFCSLDHVVVSLQGGGFVGATDLALEAIGRRRHVALSTSGFLIVPEIELGNADIVQRGGSIGHGLTVPKDWHAFLIQGQCVLVAALLSSDRCKVGEGTGFSTMIPRASRIAETLVEQHLGAFLIGLD